MDGRGDVEIELEEGKQSKSKERLSKKEKGKGSIDREGFDKKANSSEVEFNDLCTVEQERDKKHRKKKDGCLDSSGVVDSCVEELGGERSSESRIRKEVRNRKYGDKVREQSQDEVNRLTEVRDDDSPIEKDLVIMALESEMENGEPAKKKKKEKRRKEEMQAEEKSEKPERGNDNGTPSEKDLLTLDNEGEGEEPAKKKKRKREKTQAEERIEKLRRDNDNGTPIEKDLMNETVDNEKENEKPAEKKKKRTKEKTQAVEKNEKLRRDNDNGTPSAKDLVTLDNEGEGEKPANKKRKRKKEKMQAEEKNEHVDVVADDADHDGEATEELTRKKKHKKKRGKVKYDSSVAGKNVDEDNELKTTKKKKRVKEVEDKEDKSTPNKSNKKVRFSDEVEIHPVPTDLDTEGTEEGNLVQGKRFTAEEDEAIMQTVHDYIEEHDLGEQGLEMVLNSSKHKEVRGCWKDIASAIPYRPKTSVYCRAQVLFRRSEARKWTKEEYELVWNHVREHGNEWKELAEELGKHRFHVKDAWRRTKLENMKKGHWSQDEYQKLFDLVNIDLQKRATEEKKSKHGMLRDNICWTAISEILETRAQANCCIKWYNQLTSPMVAKKLWSDTDDYHLITELYNLDATCMEDVDWDDLIEHRTGDICRKRWNEMVLHIGHHGNKTFAEQVEVLAQRYCPYLLEARETWDKKPRVP